MNYGLVPHPVLEPLWVLGTILLVLAPYLIGLILVVVDFAKMVSAFSLPVHLVEPGKEGLYGLINRESAVVDKRKLPLSRW